VRNEFQSKLYQTAQEICRAVALAWLSFGGRSDPKQVAAILAYKTNQELADDAIKGFGLGLRTDHAKGSKPLTWMEQRGVTREDIAAAFASLRRNLEESPEEMPQ
jgi:hypothetical protein